MWSPTGVARGTSPFSVVELLRRMSIFGVTRRSTSAYAKAMVDTRSRFHPPSLRDYGGQASTVRIRGFLRRQVK